MPGVLKCMETLYAPLPLITVSAYLESPISMNIGEYGVERVQIGKLTVPTDEVGRMLINYRGTEKTFPHIPVTDILNNNIADTVVKDKIVIVGATAVGIYDLRVTPFGTVFPGVEIHANVVDSILIKKDNKPFAKLTAISKFGKKRIAGLNKGEIDGHANLNNSTSCFFVLRLAAAQQSHLLRRRLFRRSLTP